MRKNKVIIFLITILLLMITILNIGVEVFADDSTSMVDPTEDPGYYKPTNTYGDGYLTNKAGNLLQVINVIGVVVSVITLMIIGIKYMLGSIEEKAEYKKTAIIYLIGAALLFGGTTIPNILYKIGKNML